MEKEGRARLTDARFEGRVSTRRSADMRYGEQIFEVPVGLDLVDWQDTELMGQLVEAFHDRHEELFTYALRDQEVVLVNARMAVIGELSALPIEPPRSTSRAAEPLAFRRIYLNGWQEVAVYGFEDIAIAQVISGPAVIESSTTTVLLREGDFAKATPLGWLDIAVRERPAPA
jgi:N-methylhydantoinase A